MGVLKNFGLPQNISVATHNRGHILDLITSKCLNISEVTENDAALSDRYCVLFKMTTLADFTRGT